VGDVGRVRRDAAAIRVPYYPDIDGPAEHIIADPATPAVWLHPLRRQGQPTLNSIRTKTLTELVTAGEPMQFVADTYGLTLAEVE